MQYYNWGQILHPFILFLKKKKALLIITIFNPIIKVNQF